MLSSGALTGNSSPYRGRCRDGRASLRISRRLARKGLDDHVIETLLLDVRIGETFRLVSAQHSHQLHQECFTRPKVDSIERINNTFPPIIADAAFLLPRTVPSKAPTKHRISYI